MATLYDILRPYRLIFLIFGINLDPNGQSNKLRKWTVKAILTAWNGSLLFTEAAYVLLYFRLMSALEVRQDRKRSSSVDQFMTFVLYNYYFISAWTRTYMFFATRTTDYSATWKRFEVRDGDYTKLKRKTIYKIVILAAINIIPIIAVINYSVGRIQLSVAQETVLIIFLIVPLLHFCFPSICCLLYSTNTDYLGTQLDNLSSELQKPKSPYRLNRILKKVNEEFQHIEQLAHSMNDLFAPMVTATALNNLIVVPSLMSAFNSSFSSFQWLGRFTMLSIVLVPCTVFYSVYEAAQCNLKLRNFLQLMAERVQDEKGSSRLSLDLVQPRIDWLCRVLNKRIENADWFTMSWGIEMDQDLFFIAVQLVRDILRFTYDYQVVTYKFYNIKEIT